MGTNKNVWLGYDRDNLVAIFHDPKNAGVYKDSLEEWELEGNHQESISKVWVAFEYYYPYDEDDETQPLVLGVFASEEEAEKKHPDAGYIELYDLDDNVQVVWGGQAPRGKSRWHVSIDRKGKKKASAFPDNRAFKEKEYHCWTGSSTVFCWASSPEEAIKIGGQKAQEYEFLKWARG